MAELSVSYPGSAVAATGISPEEHELIDSMVHNLAEDSYTEIVRGGDGKVSNVNTLTAPAGTNIRTVSVSRNPAGTVTGTVDIQYDENGNEVQRITTSITRDGTGTVVSTSTTEEP